MIYGSENLYFFQFPLIKSTKIKLVLPLICALPSPNGEGPRVRRKNLATAQAFFKEIAAENNRRGRKAVRFERKISRMLKAE